ncbi:hypothetical protein [Chitinimonas sp. JJ19]|uniref:hypothetical protein n=1 Tax=Chitinimonas sp. JJ19 TaxID=3109352 RepID=UPI003002B9BC
MLRLKSTLAALLLAAAPMLALADKAFDGVWQAQHGEYLIVTTSGTVLIGMELIPNSASQPELAGPLSGTWADTLLAQLGQAGEFAGTLNSGKLSLPMRGRLLAPGELEVTVLGCSRPGETCADTASMVVRYKKVL